MQWTFLGIAILLEVCGTTLMKRSDGFTKMIYAIPMLILYILSLTMLSFALKKMEVGVAYAIWSGIGIALIATIGVVFFEETCTISKIIFLSFIIIGAIGLNLSGAGH
ncbi:small multidrug resistance pump [Sporomusaceae bacterium BoRhaA]|uniref:DMT family transporter n=1 Tax=Pelorhabdus rhamnosifermentans TaxID=2772457 RepID=UPI001C062F5A|nr:multidrug efflux SMR transporter [Pelorhabdus rhamnosifermentans]MBU2700027.1 small multidrug resistance pump [Pelorhabdus rhamnosifermentans]